MWASTAAAVEGTLFPWAWLPFAHAAACWGPRKRKGFTLAAFQGREEHLSFLKHHQRTPNCSPLALVSGRGTSLSVCSVGVKMTGLEVRRTKIQIPTQPTSPVGAPASPLASLSLAALLCRVYTPLSRREFPVGLWPSPGQTQSSGGRGWGVWRGLGSCCHSELLDSHSAGSILQDTAFHWNATSEESSGKGITERGKPARDVETLDWRGQKWC